MKFLCVCQYGHSRSVAMCRALHALKHEAVAAGLGTAPNAIPVIAKWADLIIVMEGWMVAQLPPGWTPVVVCDVGPDVWSNPYHPQLRELCQQFCTEKGWDKSC